MPSDRAIQLVPAISPYVAAPASGARLTIVAAQAVGMDPAVFAYLAGPPQPGSSDQVATFDHVCSPADLAEYPVDAPADDAVPAWFRTNSVDLLFRSTSQARAAMDAIVAQVGVLVATLDRLDTLSALPPVWLGPPPT